MEKDIPKSEEELTAIADMLLEEIKGGGEQVSRFTQVTHEYSDFFSGKRVGGITHGCNVNRENIDQGVYTLEVTGDVNPSNFSYVAVARDLQENRFNFPQKGNPLPLKERKFCHSIPTETDIYDAELREFTRTHPNTTIRRRFTLDQRVVVNSHGGILIQSIPFFSITFNQGYPPIPTQRDVAAVCSSNEDIRNISQLIEYLPDPTLDRRIRKSKSFSEAFHNLHEVAGLKYGSLEDAGIPLSELYDVVMLTGVPVHEIFGHHFEEPMRFLDFGESGTFKRGQRISNAELKLEDDPLRVIGGLNVLGFSHFDAYGRESHRTTHIDNGEVNDFLGGEYADQGERLNQYMNVNKSQFIGNSRQSNEGFFPQPRMSCTVLDGKVAPCDLEGKILLVPCEGHTYPAEKTYLVRSYESYVIINGQPQRVVPLQVTGGINQALANINLLEDWSYQTGECGKPEPVYRKQESRVPVSQCCRNQVWRGQQVYPLPISEAHLKVLSRRNETS